MPFFCLRNDRLSIFPLKLLKNYWIQQWRCSWFINWWVLQIQWMSARASNRVNFVLISKLWSKSLRSWTRRENSNCIATFSKCGGATPMRSKQLSFRHNTIIWWRYNVRMSVSYIWTWFPCYDRLISFLWRTIRRPDLNEGKRQEGQRRQEKDTKVLRPKEWSVLEHPLSCMWGHLGVLWRMRRPRKLKTAPGWALRSMPGRWGLDGQAIVKRFKWGTILMGDMR